MDLNDPCLQTDGSCLVRLHVGGLGPSVISSDLVQTFSSLAKVSSVDMVRTKGRNFAYVTIQAAPQDIKRLFSLYNGCMWKGGRLKLEKAREFYLDKLHREWAERDCLQDVEAPKLDCITSAKSITKSKETDGFNIYIPKIRKVKKIPEKGLGRHKRSFQRVDPLPFSLLHVCNCDEHCMATRKETQDPKNAPIRTSMKESGTVCEQSYKGSGSKGRKVVQENEWKHSDERGANTIPDLDEQFLNMKGDDAEGITELDEPVLNITGSDESYFGQRMNSVEEEAHAIITQQVQACKEEAQGVKEAGHAQRKRLKLDLHTSAREETKPSEAENNVSPILQSGETNKSNKVFKILDGRSWVQKASWKSLVGATGHMSFSLGNMLDQNLTISPSTGDLMSMSEKLGQLSRFEKSPLINGSSVPSFGLSQEMMPLSRLVDSKKSSKSVNGRNSKNSELNYHQHEEALVQDGGGAILQDRGCTFVKSGKSEQEWLESKQAVKEIVKRSRKDALRSLQGFYMKQKH